MFDTRLIRRPVQLHLDGLVLDDQVLVPRLHHRHPGTTAAGEACMPWLEAMGLMDLGLERTFRRARFHELMGVIYLEESPEDLALCSQFACLLFATDDLFDDLQGLAWRDQLDRAQAAIGAIQGSAHSGQPRADFDFVPRQDRQPLRAISRAYADLTRRLSTRGRSLGPYLRAIDVYLEGTADEARHRKQGSYASLDVYAAARRRFSAMDVAVELGLLLRRAEPPPAHWDELVRLTNLHVSYVNDLFSCAKERRNGEVSNLVTVVQSVEQCPLPEAVWRSCRVIDGLSERYSALRPERRTSATALLEHWMRGSYEWHAYATVRYGEGLSVAPTCLTLAAAG